MATDDRHPPVQPASEISLDSIDKPGLALHKYVGTFSSDWHAHKKYQLLYAEDGVVFFESEYRSMLLPARHAAWIPARCLHRVSSSSPALSLRMLYFRPKKYKVKPLPTLTVFAISQLAREMILYTEKWNFSLRTDDPTEEIFIESIYSLVPEWAKVQLPLTLPRAKNPRLQTILDYICSNMCSQLRLKDIAPRYAMSERTLTRLFQRDLSMSYCSYLRVARIVKALGLLSLPGASITTTALEVGFDSVSSFSSSFRKLMGMQPRQYMKTMAVSELKEAKQGSERD